MSKPIKKPQHKWTLPENQKVLDTYLLFGDSKTAAQLLATEMSGPSWQSIKCKFRSFHKCLNGSGLSNMCANSSIVITNYLRALHANR